MSTSGTLLDFHRPRTLLLIGLFLIGLFGAGCGSERITRPQDLGRPEGSVYPSGEGFSLTLIMQACSDNCAEYDEPSCSASVDIDAEKEKFDINIDVSLSVKSRTDDCITQCGPQKLAHCDIPALEPGKYTVKANGFIRTITVE